MNTDINAVWQSPRGAAKAGCLPSANMNSEGTRKQVLPLHNQSPFPSSVFSLHTHSPSRLAERLAWKWLRMFHSTCPLAFPTKLTDDPEKYLTDCCQKVQLFDWNSLTSPTNGMFYRQEGMQDDETLVILGHHQVKIFCISWYLKNRLN